VCCSSKETCKIAIRARGIFYKNPNPPSKSVFPLLVVINTFGIANVVYMRTVFKYAQRLSGWGKKAIISLEYFP
jgi:hypothetical protein